MTKKLSEEVVSSVDYEEIEEILFDEGIVIDTGYYLELYGNPDGKHFDGERSNGSSCFVFIDQELTYGELLKLFENLGSVSDDTLTIRIIDDFETQEREFCKRNPISRFIK